MVRMASTNPTGVPVTIPQDVLDMLRRIFGAGNAEVSNMLSRQPMSREDHLDQALITYLDKQSPEVAPHSGWIVDCETHFLGNGRHFGVWEIADIGVLIILRRGDTVVWSKVAVLQSKRLFPLGSVHDEDAERARFRWGFGRLHGSYDVSAVRRTYNFTEESTYASLDLYADQARRIDAYQGEMTIPVHYLLYNPLQLPWSRTLPVAGPAPLGSNDVGCRIVRARQMFTLRNVVAVPRYSDLRDISAPHAHAPFLAGWRLEDFIVALLLGCHEGKVLDASLDNAMELLFYRRTGPISAAFAVNIWIAE